MTEDQKDILINKMLDAPSSLSDSEMEKIVTDDELLEIYEMSAVVCGAFISRREIDVSKELESFRPLIRRKSSRMRWTIRVVAVFVGIIFTSAIFYKIINSFLNKGSQPVIVKVEQNENYSNTFPTVNEEESSIQNKSYEVTNAAVQPLSTSTLRNFKTKKLEYKNKDKDKDIEDDIENNIEVEEYLRIQQAQIDNDLAVQTAEIYMDEIDRIRPILHAAGLHDVDIDLAVQRVTMQ